jgi:acyl-CoA synthetase (AMP-forming)/AMP-acid ligase II
VADIADLVAMHAQDRPATVAIEVLGGERLTYGGLDRRSNRLARALLRLGVQPGERIAVVTCDAHAPDAVVGMLATTRADAAPLPLAPDPTALAGVDGRVVLACAEGVAACRRAGVRGVLVGDGEGVEWWKALELRSSAAPLTRTSTGALATVGWAGPAPLDRSGLLHSLPVVAGGALHDVVVGALAAGVPQRVQVPFEPVGFAAQLDLASTACLLPPQVDLLPAGTAWVAAGGVCWHAPVTVDLDAEGGYGVGLATAALTA